MAGLFDSLKVGLSGIKAYRKFMEVSSSNIANAANDDYTKRDISLTTATGFVQNGLYAGCGVSVSDVKRICDGMLEKSIRGSLTSCEANSLMTTFLQKIESAYDEPSEYALSGTLSDFWASWSTFANDPENLAIKDNVLSNVDELSASLNAVYKNLQNIAEEMPGEIENAVDKINDIAEEIADLNKGICFTRGDRLDLLDTRDAKIKELAKLVDIDVFYNGDNSLSIYVEDDPLVLGNNFKKLGFDDSNVVWNYGEKISKGDKDLGGQLGTLMTIFSEDIPSRMQALDDLASSIIEGVNGLYVNGVSSGRKELVSDLGCSALGVESIEDPLSLVLEGEKGEIFVTFYDDDGNQVRTNGIVVDNNDSLMDVRDKLNSIPGISVDLFSTNEERGRFKIVFDEGSLENSLGESSIAINSGEEVFDSSGVLGFLGFSSTAKSDNDGNSVPAIFSKDVDEIREALGKTTVAEAFDTSLGMNGKFAISLFDIATETEGLLNGSRALRLDIEVESSDSIDDIVDKVNDAGTMYGISLAIDSATNALKLSSTMKSDDEGIVEFPAGSGSHFLRISFSDRYHPEDNIYDQPPAGNNALGDNTGLFAKMQMNTLFQGKGAADIALNRGITSPSMLHSGYTTNSGDNSLALDIYDLQYRNVETGEYTINELYENIISSIGGDVNAALDRENNDNAVLNSLLEEKAAKSGVNLDEELAKMITYQRYYQGNGKVISMIDEMLADLIKII